MAPLSNKERQAAFRARKKVQPFADKHFGGMHVATVDQFLDALKIEREALTATFPDHDLSGMDIKNTAWFQMTYWREEGRLAADFIADAQNSQKVEELGTEATRALHAQGYFEGLPDYASAWDDRFEDLVRGHVSAEADRVLDQLIASLSEEERVQLIFQEENGDPTFEGGANPLKSQQYPLYQLIEEFKKLVGMP